MSSSKLFPVKTENLFFKFSSPSEDFEFVLIESLIASIPNCKPALFLDSIIPSVKTYIVLSVCR
jgi:hypothetical protein